MPEDKPQLQSDEIPYPPEKYPGKLCCFCNLGERSSLGQGDFIRLEIKDDEDESKSNITEDVSLPICEDIYKVDSSPLTVSRRFKSTKYKVPFGDDYSNELEKVGQTDIMSFDALIYNGFIYFHHKCALWSFGDKTFNVQGNPNVRKIIIKSLVQKCSFCGQYGASIVCRMNCLKAFHLPCAAASGCFLIFESLSLYCTNHLNEVLLLDKDNSIYCRQCSIIGNISKLIMCSTCGDHFHTTCIGLVNLPETKAGWNCLQCTKCQICRQLDSTEGRSIKCEQCQKLYHCACLRPAILSIPKFGWKCNRCRVCTDCGSRTPGAGTSSRWHCHYTICDSCYQQRNKGFSCPICHKAYRAAAYKEMVKCNCCHRFVHSFCDEEADLSVYHKRKEKNPDYDYICPSCKSILVKEKIQFNSEQHIERDSKLQSSNETDIDLHEKSYLDFNFVDKSLEDAKFVKRRIPIKDVQRSRWEKSTIQKSSILSHIAKKRNARGRSRHVLLLNRMNSGNNDNFISRCYESDFAAEKKLLLFSNKDKFILSQDICLMCGSVGIDRHDSLISCVQCGQCFHLYCVNVKLSKVVLEKGWRCLDCSVCEGCGQKNDEARLILCDECDISYHIYCITPPLDAVPHGNWKCRWCAVCQICGQRCVEKTSIWENSSLKCGTCASQSRCFMCLKQYKQNDLIMQCKTCKRWLHGSCDSIHNEQEAKLCMKRKYNCAQCRPKDELSHVIAERIQSPITSSTSTFPFNIDKNNVCNTNSLANDNIEGTVYCVDGVCISETGLSVIKSLTSEIKRKRKIRTLNSNQIDDSETFSKLSVLSSENAEGNVCNTLNLNEVNDKPEILEHGMVLENSNNIPPEGFSILTNKDGVSILRRKRQRNLQRLGIGGFSAKSRSLKKDKDENNSLPTDKRNNSLNMLKKKKLTRKKNKIKLIETYPAYLQEAFFGKTLLNKDQSNMLLNESESSEEVDYECSFPDVKIKKKVEDCVSVRIGEASALMVSKEEINLSYANCSSLDRKNTLDHGKINKFLRSTVTTTAAVSVEPVVPQSSTSDIQFAN